MNRRTFVKTLPALTVLASTTASFAQDTPKADSQLKPITLPKPEADGGKSVLAALKERKTTRRCCTTANGSVAACRETDHPMPACNLLTSR